MIDLTITVTTKQVSRVDHHAADVSHLSTGGKDADDDVDSHDQIVSHAEPSHLSETTSSALAWSRTKKCIGSKERGISSSGQEQRIVFQAVLTVFLMRTNSTPLVMTPFESYKCSMRKPVCRRSRRKHAQAARSSLILSSSITLNLGEACQHGSTPNS